MYATLLADARFHELLLTIDRDLADACRAAGCLACGGRLHLARYPRKPRGRPKTLAGRLGPEHDLRFSFCCAIDGEQKLVESGIGQQGCVQSRRPPQREG